jgi:hypothetical protein
LEYRNSNGHNSVCGKDRLSARSLGGRLTRGSLSTTLGWTGRAVIITAMDGKIF